MATALPAGTNAINDRVKQLEEELDFTHAHYHKLLEQVPAHSLRLLLAVVHV